MKHQQILIAALGLAFCGSAFAADFDATAAEKLARKSGCFKCHAIDKKKDGPPYHEIAGKYKGKPDAEATLFKHATTNPKVKIEGKEEEHDTLKTTDEAEIKNVVRWVLAQ